MAESFRFRYDSAMMSVQEYAQEAKVSERSVRARLERGMLQGRKLGGRWVVDALPAAHRSNAGRPISFDAFNALARYCDGQSSVLSAEERRRAKERASAIQMQGPASVERYRARRGLKVHHLQPLPLKFLQFWKTLHCRLPALVAIFHRCTAQWLMHISRAKI